MKKLLVLLSLILSQSAFASETTEAETKVSAVKEGDFKVCRNYSSARVSFDYAKCVRANFAVVEKVMNIPLQKCYNNTETVTSAFLQCISNNFQKLINQTNLDVHFCYSNDGAMTSSFTSCIGRNFTQLTESFKVLDGVEVNENRMVGLPTTEPVPDGNLAILEHDAR